MRKKIDKEGCIYFVFRDVKKNPHYLTVKKEGIIIDNIVMDDHTACDLLSKLALFLDEKRES